MIVLFQVFTYASVGYKTETTSKTSFIGRESYEKSFYRWLSIFDTFPEGMAIVKDDGSIMYSNDSLARLFECDALPKTKTTNFSQVGIKSDHSYQAKLMLENVKIRQHAYEDAEREIKPIIKDREKPDHSVWDFITKNYDGATYEIMKSPMYKFPVAEEQKKLISNDGPPEENLEGMSRVDGD